MLARRIVAVSPDKTFGKQLAMALRVAGGAVDLHHALDALGPDDLHAALWVIHLDGALSDAAHAILPQLAGEARAVFVLPRSHLATIVDGLLASDRVAGVMIAEDFDGQALSAMARRLLTGDVFGLEKLMTWGVQIHSQLVGDYHEKSVCMSQVAEFTELVGMPRGPRAAIEQCIDEMVMNALYDAPVDQDGAPIFRDVPIKTRIALRTEQMVVVRYAYDGRRFAVSVRDSFGSLDRDRVLGVLHKCLHAEQPVDRRAGGAGVGLYLVASSATTLYFNVAPGVATEVICAFDLEAAAPQLAQAGFFVEDIDAERADGEPPRQFSAGPLRAIEPRRPTAPGGRFVTVGLSIAIAATLVLIAIAAWPRLFGVRGAEIAITTIPPGAAIEIEGRKVGTAATGTLVVDDLTVGRTYSVLARLDGYQARQAVVQPHAGSNALTLELPPQTAMVELDSEPSGAVVEVAGKPVGATPLTLTSLAPGADVAIVFRRTGYRE
ncbi:MAG TPA: PEGA domain-containing protein, partial [Kofleriaceae bacterium]|nr:PEGA domain-containing protein [Kofleriaceae bacterium]